MPGDGHFRLEKWYVDVVDEARHAHIAYWARLSWLGLAVTWQSVASYTPGAAPRRRQSLRARPAPLRQPDGITWDAPALRSKVSARPTIGGFAQALDSRVEWECVAPGARVQFTVDDQVSRGVSYVERIALSVAPWRLPIRELRWGRWCSADGDRSVVWIEWRHDATRSWVYVDGELVAAAITDDGVTTDRVRLVLDGRQVLEQRSFAEVARRIPRLPGMIPASMRDMKEEKWLSHGLLHEEDSPPTPGMSIHEVVTFG